MQQVTGMEFMIPMQWRYYIYLNDNSLLCFTDHFPVHVFNIFLSFSAIGFNVETVQFKNLKFQVWDLGGQTSIRYVISIGWGLLDSCYKELDLLHTYSL